MSYIEKRFATFSLLLVLSIYIILFFHLFVRDFIVSIGNFTMNIHAHVNALCIQPCTIYPIYFNIYLP